jgi:hypothetical protein
MHHPSTAAIRGFPGSWSENPQRRPAGPSGAVDEGLDVLEVGTRAERPSARPGYHQHVRSLVGGEVLDGLAEQTRGCRIDAVPDVGTVQGQDRDRPSSFHQYSGHGGDGTEPIRPQGRKMG